MSTAPLHDTTLPPTDETGVESVRRVDDLLAQPKAKLVAPDGTSVEVPPQVQEVLAKVIETMRAGRTVTIAPMEQHLTTSQAAEFLGVSRPTLVKLLEENEIPYEKVTRHRRVHLDDLLAFREQRRAGRRATLDEMTRQAAADGLYEDRAADYSDVLREARQSRSRGNDG